jgi:hypothetical protein
MVLFGPGVIEVTRANRAKPNSRSSERFIEAVHQGHSAIDPIPHGPANPRTVRENFKQYSLLSAWTAVQLYGTFGAHLTLLIEAESLLRLTEQLSFFRVVFVERQAAAVQRFQRQFAGLFSGVRAQFWRNMAGTTGEYGNSEHQQNSQ